VGPRPADAGFPDRVNYLGDPPELLRRLGLVTISVDDLARFRRHGTVRRTGLPGFPGVTPIARRSRAMAPISGRFSHRRLAERGLEVG
jgi:hypothetical protein